MDTTQPDNNIYHALFENTADAILALKGDVIVECNAITAELFGCPREQIIGQSVCKFSPERQPDERSSKEKAAEKTNAALEDGTQRFEWLYTRCDGSLLNAEVALNRVEVGGEAMLVAVVRDITLRKRLEDAVHNVAAGISAATGDLFFNLLVNYLARALGASAVFVGEMIGDTHIRTVAFCTEGLSAPNFEYDLPGTPCQLVMGDGLCMFPSGVREQFPDDSLLQRVHAESYVGVPLLDSNHEPLGLLSAIRRAPIDDTAFAEYMMRIFAGRTAAELERKRSLRELTDEKKLTEAIINSLPGVFYMINQEGKAVWRNKRLSEISGYGINERSESKVLEFVIDEDREAAERAIEQAFTTGSSVAELRFRHRDGAVRAYYCTGARIEMEGENYIVGTGVDISELKQAQSALLESEAKHRTIFENAPVGIFHSTTEGRLLSVNPTLARMLGYDSPEELVAESTDIATQLFVHPERRAGMVAEAVKSEGFVRFENEYRRKDGVVIVANLYMRAQRVGDRVEFLEGFVEDITDRKRSDEDKRLFYRDTVMSVTDGTLAICEASDLQPYLLNAQMRMTLRDAHDLAPMRSQVREFCANAGLLDERLETFIAGVGEAATNAVKHADGGQVYAGISEDAVWVGVSDEGPGIEHITLPRAVLQRGFSTKHSLGIGYSVMLGVADRIMLSTGKQGTTVILLKELHEKPQRILFDQLPDYWDTPAPG